ncbi:VOC family protein [Telmatospirillum sp.]|uniref:VOC family protein n=1 Tax=Telmatospirillum sp. TaxID=2079197 RepID=UPI00284D2628|nr:VOC family protein [Telmatospirillum sp.]MDR3439812.1 VOC family protein [Telmatospirillum sp.]
MKLGYVIIYVPDVAQAVDFYERAFGLKRHFIDDACQFAEMETGATALAFAKESLVREMGVDFQPLRVDQSPAGIEIALIADDVPAALARATAAGATVVKQPEKKSWGRPWLTSATSTAPWSSCARPLDDHREQQLRNVSQEIRSSSSQPISFPRC